MSIVDVNVQGESSLVDADRRKSLRDRLPAAISERLPGGDHGYSGTVGLVRIHGVIASRSPIAGGAVVSASGIEKSLKQAFSHNDLKAVVLLINSPGGSPVQSELIGARILQLREEWEKEHDGASLPILAFCEDVAASGGYWIACAADEIFVAKTSLIGSIGVVSQGFGVTELAKKVGIERRTHTAGTNKVRLDPFSAEKPEDIEWLKALQSDIHHVFYEWVQGQRGDRLKGTKEELFNGDVWVGDKAIEAGIADHVGLLHEVLEQRFPKAELKVSTSKRSFLARLGFPGVLQEGLSPAAMVQSWKNEQTWTRFDL